MIWDIMLLNKLSLSVFKPLNFYTTWELNVYNAIKETVNSKETQFEFEQTDSVSPCKIYL